jgi:hypothetical protein
MLHRSPGKHLQSIAHDRPLPNPPVPSSAVASSRGCCSGATGGGHPDFSHLRRDTARCCILAKGGIARAGRTRSHHLRLSQTQHNGPDGNALSTLPLLARLGMAVAGVAIDSGVVAAQASGRCGGDGCSTPRDLWTKEAGAISHGVDTSTCAKQRVLLPRTPEGQRPDREMSEASRCRADGLSHDRGNSEDSHRRLPQHPALKAQRSSIHSCRVQLR